MTGLKVSMKAGRVGPSTNRKTGPIPVTSRTGASCPRTCVFVNPETLEPGKGCYGNGRIAYFAKRDARPESETLEKIRREVPADSMIRHHEVGDITSAGELDRGYLASLAALGAARPDLVHIMYTHAWRLDTKAALGLPWAVNASCETPADVQSATDAGYMAVVVVPDVESIPAELAGRRVVRCPAELRPGIITCKNCGLCAKGDTESNGRTHKRAVVAFVAHGSGKKETAYQVRRRNGGEVSA